MENQKILRCLMMLMVMSGMFASGQIFIQNNPIGTDDSKAILCQPNVDCNLYDIFQDQYHTVYVPKQEKLTQENQQQITVTLQFIYDENIYRPADCFVYNANSWVIPMGYNQRTCSLEPGIYDIFAQFICYEPEIHGLNNIIIKELIEITKDTVIELRQDEIINKIECVARNQNGERFEHELGFLDTNNEWVTSEYGNIQNTLSILDIRGCERSFTMGSTVSQVTFDRTGSFMDLRINDVSDRYSIIISKTNYDANNHTFYVNKFCPKNVHVKIIDNNPADYLHTTETYHVSLLGKNSGFRGINVIPELLNNNYLVTMSTTQSFPISGEEDKIDVDFYLNNPFDESNGNVLGRFWFTDNTHPIVQTYITDQTYVTDTAYIYTKTIAQPMVVNDGEIMYYVKGQVENTIDNDFNPFIRDENKKYNYIAHPAFTFTKSQKGMDWGTTVPVGSLCNETTYNPSLGGNYMRLSLNYYGGLGELRINDLDALSMRLRHNGEEVCDNYFKLDSLGRAMALQQFPAGIIEATILNENVEVDGLPGKNFAQMHIDETKEDKDGPSLTMLWFKNAEGKITDRFAKSQDGILEFSAGDFNTMYDADVSAYTWFDCQKPDVEVSYAPYGEKSWNELEVEEVPENFYMPCFGHFYRGSLAGVTGQALKGWFDLKVKLTDAAGNWQEQVISPAFKIDSYTTGISDVNSDNAHEVARYNLAGQRVGANTSGVVIVRYNDGTARKMIVK